MPRVVTEAEGEGEDDLDADADTVVEPSGDELNVKLCETLLELLRVASREAVPSSEAEEHADAEGEPVVEITGLLLVLGELLPL